MLLEISTGAVPWNSGTTPANATIVTNTVSGDETMGTRRLRSSSRASGGKATAVSARVSGREAGRTTTKRTRSIESPNDARPVPDGKTGVPATRAYCNFGPLPSRQVTSVRRRPKARRARRDIGASELASVRSTGQDGMFGVHAHRTPHARLY